MANLTANPRLRYLYTAWAFLECVGFGGLLFGWGSLVFVLKAEGIYSDLCSDSPLKEDADDINGTLSVPDNSTLPGSEDEEGCKAQDNRLALVFTIGSAMLGLGSFIIGQLNFKFGTRVSRIVATTVYTMGAVMIAFTSKENPWLIFPGLSCIGFGGIAYIITNTQISNLFPTGGAAVVGILCGGFDSGAGIQLLIKIGYENGITRQTSYIIIACTHLLTFVSTFLFLPKDFIHKANEKSNYEEEITVGEKPIEMKNGKAEKEKGEDGPDADSGNLRNLKKHILSLTFILHVVWLSILQLSFYFFLGSVNSRLEAILDTKSDVSHYTNVLLYIMMGGIVTSPLAGAFYSWQHKLFEDSQSTLRRHVMPAVIPLALTTSLCVIMSGLILIDDPQVLYAVFILLLIFRSFLYTMAAGYLSSIYPSSYFGSLYGVMIITACIFGLLQYALFSWAEAEGFYQVNVVLLVLTFLTFAHPGYQWWACRRAENNKI